ncbi:MAG: hypothetical protein ACLVH0_04220 [Coprococcus eutactus]
MCPELCITGYTCGDLFLQETFIKKRKGAAGMAGKRELGALDAVVFVGLPLMHEGKLYNVAAALNKGEIIGIVPKTHIPNYNEFYEARYFTPGKEEAEGVDIAPAYHVPMGSHILFQCDDVLPEPCNRCGNLRGCLGSEPTEYCPCSGRSNFNRKSFCQ